MIRKTLLSAAILVALASLASAQSVQKTLADAGVLGRWAEACAQPASSNNVHVVYAVSPSGEATVVHEAAPGHQTVVNTIVEAKLVSPERLDYIQVDRRDGARVLVVLMMTGRHIKVWRSQMSTGQVLAERGKFTANGRDAPARARCG